MLLDTPVEHLTKAVCEGVRIAKTLKKVSRQVFRFRW